MGRVTGFRLPGSVINIYHPTELALFGLGGLLIAVAGRAPAGRWAAGPGPHRPRTE
jgi:putative ABC transport system permease protein